VRILHAEDPAQALPLGAAHALPARRAHAGLPSTTWAWPAVVVDVEDLEQPGGQQRVEVPADVDRRASAGRRELVDGRPVRRAVLSRCRLVVVDLQREGLGTQGCPPRSDSPSATTRVNQSTVSAGANHRSPT
jgi:hypothetical protein